MLILFLRASLPGAIGMYGLSVGIARVGDTLPSPVYALLSGLNAATIGIIALAAVNLAGRAITDELTRILVFLGGALGMLYTALWYYPVVMVGAGLATMGWDLRWPHTIVEYAVVRPWRRIQRKRNKEANAFDAEKGHESWPRRTAIINLNILPSSEKPLPAAPRNSEIFNLTEIDARYLHPRPVPVPVPVPVPISKFAIMPPPQPSQQQPSQQKPTPFPILVPLRTGSLILIIFALSFLAPRRPHQPNLPKLINSRENQPHRRGINPPQRAPKPPPPLQLPPNPQKPQQHHHPGRENGQERQHRARSGGQTPFGGERAQVDGEIEVGAGEGLDDGEAEEEVARGDPAGGDEVGAEEGDDDGAAAEDDGAGEVEGGEEGEGAGFSCFLVVEEGA